LCGVRVITDNERLKRDVFEKSARIEQQNEKIQDLLEVYFICRWGELRGYAN
jgi:hypothetical protein